jgi:hypothetical protein
MDKGPSLEADSHSTDQEIPSHLQKLKVCVHSSLLLCFLGMSHNRLTCILASSCPSIHLPAQPSARISAAPIGQIPVKFDIEGFYENLSRKSKFVSNHVKIQGILHEDLSTLYDCQ